MSTLATLADALGQGAIIGAHLVSLHSAPTYYTKVDEAGRPMDEQHFRSATPGAYVRLANGATFGAYRNSYGVGSAYVGWTFTTADGRWAFTAGGVTGYRGAAVQPLLIPSFRMPLGDDGWALRLSLAPKPPREAAAATLHISVEKAL